MTRPIDCHLALLPTILCAPMAGCSSGNTANDPVILETDGRPVALSRLIPGTRRVSILGLWLSFDSYVMDGVAFGTPAERDTYARCPKLDENNPDGENRLVAVFPDRCPITDTFEKPIRANYPSPDRACIDPQSATVRDAGVLIEMNIQKSLGALKP